MYVTREANRMVEEMMLLANVASAEAILKAFPSQAMLRRQALVSQARDKKVMQLLCINVALIK